MDTDNTLPLPTLTAFADRVRAMDLEKKLAAVINMYGTHPLANPPANMTAKEAEDRATHAGLFEAVVAARDELLKMLNGSI